MIDHEARKKAAETLRHFMSGQISNFQFEDRMPNTKDKAVVAIFDSAWLLYDDFKSHKFHKEYKASKELMESMSRWVMFLHTSEEYQWPSFSYPGLRPLEHDFFSKFLRGPQKEKQFMETGDYSVWPFISISSFQHAKQNPVLLAGS